MAFQMTENRALLTDDDVITLYCEQQTIRAHKCILSAASEFFKHLLRDLPGTQTVVALADVSFVDLRAIVTYIYVRSVVIEDRQRASFLAAAKKLRVNVADNAMIAPPIRETEACGDSVRPKVLPKTKQETKKSDQRQANNTGSTFVKRVNVILNELKIHTTDEAVSKLLALENIRAAERASLVVHMAVEWGIKNSRHVTVFGRLCKHLIERDHELKDRHLFRQALIRKCDDLFNEANDRSHGHGQARRLRCLGIIRFIAALFMYSILPAKMIGWIASLLLDSPRQDTLDYLYELLAIVGKRIERSGDGDGGGAACDLSEHFATIEAIVNDAELGLSADTCGRWRMLLLNRQNKWTQPNDLLLGDCGPIMRKSGEILAKVKKRGIKCR